MVPTPAAWLCPPWAQGCCPRGQALRRGRTGSTPLGKGFTFSSLSFPLVQDRPPGSCPWNAAAVRPEALDAFGISELLDTRSSLWPHSHQTQEDKEEPPEHGSPEPAEEQGAQGPGCWGSAVRGWGLDGAGQRGSPSPGAGGGGLSTPGRGPCSTAASEAACPGPARTGSARGPRGAQRGRPGASLRAGRSGSAEAPHLRRRPPRVLRTRRGQLFRFWVLAMVGARSAARRAGLGAEAPNGAGGRGGCTPDGSPAQLRPRAADLPPQTRNCCGPAPPLPASRGPRAPPGAHARSGRRRAASGLGLSDGAGPTDGKGRGREGIGAESSEPGAGPGDGAGPSAGQNLRPNDGE